MLVMCAVGYTFDLLQSAVAVVVDGRGGRNVASAWHLVVYSWVCLRPRPAQGGQARIETLSRGLEYDIGDRTLKGRSSKNLASLCFGHSWGQRICLLKNFFKSSAIGALYNSA